MIYFNENKYIRWVFDIIIIVFIVNKYARVGVKETPNDSRHYSYNFKKDELQYNDLFEDIFTCTLTSFNTVMETHVYL